MSQMKKILVVEDEISFQDILGRTLAAEGFEVLQAWNAEEAWNLFSSGPLPDLAILDVNLPGGQSGFELLKRIRQEISQKIPVMMLTVRSSEEDQVHGLDIGADAYLPKPFKVAELLARLRGLLRE